MSTVVVPAPINDNHVAPVTAGGTGASTAAAARTNLDVYSKSEVTSAISQSTAYSVSDLTCDTSIGVPSDLRIIRYGKLRIITGGITPAISQGTWKTLLTLQESDRPTVSIIAPLYGFNTSSTAEAVLRPTGNFQVNFAAGTSTSATLKINMTYIVA